VSRNITLAFNFDVNPEAVARLLRASVNPTTQVVVGEGESVNGIPLGTIAVISRNEKD
jgi:hypothetical protein